MGLKEQLAKLLSQQHGKREVGQVRLFPAEISYDSEELKNLIIRWTENEGWAPQAFLDILETLGIKPPLHLSNLDKEDASFTCVSGKEEPIGISLRFGDFFDFCTEIWITKGEETNRYELWDSEDAPNRRAIRRQGRIISRAERMLENYYCEHFYNRTLSFGDTHILRVELHTAGNQKINEKIAKSAETLEAYLLELEEPVSAQKVYEELIKLLDFSEEDIRATDKILIDYRAIKENGKKKKEESRSLVYQKAGEMQEYGVLENGETFLVYRNRNWRYIGDVAQIYFNAELGKCNVMFGSTSMEDMKHLQITELMERVENRIFKLWENVE